MTVAQERFHSAMFRPPTSRTFREVVDLGRELRLLSGIAGTTVRADVAMLFDWNGWWGREEMYGLPRDFSYADTAMRHYTPLWQEHIPVDMVSTSSDLTPHKVLIVPNAYPIDLGYSAGISLRRLKRTRPCS